MDNKRDTRTQWEREEDQVCEDFNAGLITREEYNKQMRDIQRAQRDEYLEARDEAMDRFNEDWGGRW